MKINDPETWKKHWEEALLASRRKRTAIEDPGQRWNSRASHFVHSAQTPESQEKTRELLDWLIRFGALKEGSRVLDIGAGGGRYAFPMAEMGCEVVALEPASVMADHLSSRAEKDKITNLTVLNKTWQEIDLEKDGMTGAFDLVFASMTPGIGSHEDLLKMMGASRHSCYLSGNSRERWRHVEKIWPRIFGDPMPLSPGDFLYRFGLVYSLGYTPLTCSLKSSLGSTRSKTREKILEDTLWLIQGQIGKASITDTMEAIIRDYVDSLDLEAETGADERSLVSQAMLWFVTAPPSDPKIIHS